MKKILAASFLTLCTVGAYAQASAPMPAPMATPMPAASGSGKMMKGDPMKKNHMKGDHMKKDAASKPMKTDRGATPASGAM